jgi:hypothetical protein
VSGNTTSPYCRAVIIISVSCEKVTINNNFGDNVYASNIDGRWRVISYEDFEYNTLILKNDADSWDGMDVILTFSVDSMYGRNTTNTVSGKYEISDRNIRIINYGGTKVGQPEWGNMFSGIVHSLESFKINASQLRFYYNSGKKSVTLEKNSIKISE